MERFRCHFSARFRVWRFCRLCVVVFLYIFSLYKIFYSSQQDFFFHINFFYTRVTATYLSSVFPLYPTLKYFIIFIFIPSFLCSSASLPPPSTSRRRPWAAGRRLPAQADGRPPGPSLLRRGHRRLAYCFASRMVLRAPPHLHPVAAGSPPPTTLGGPLRPSSARSWRRPKDGSQQGGGGAEAMGGHGACASGSTVVKSQARPRPLAEIRPLAQALPALVGFPSTARISVVGACEEREESSGRAVLRCICRTKGFPVICR